MIGIYYLLIKNTAGGTKMSISCIASRRSVREYTAESVTDEQLKLILKSAMYAPSANNAQPWEFIVIKQRAMLDELAKGCKHWSSLTRSQLAVIVTANLINPKPGVTDFFTQDCAACTQNILLAATDLGLGAVWLGCYPREERVAYVKDLLEIPDGVIPFSVVPVGYPPKAYPPHDFYDKDKVHWEVY